jgi:hypothetical protein
MALAAGIRMGPYEIRSPLGAGGMGEVRAGHVPAQVFRLDLTTGSREEFLELMPSDRGGLIEICQITLTPDGKSYAYPYVRHRSDLGEGLRWTPPARSPLGDGRPQ